VAQPKAIATGALFDGLVDCYVLDDGRRVLSQRGAVRALTGGREGGQFGQYIERLPTKSSIESAGTNFEFERHDGGTAYGVESSTFVAILNAYVDAGLAGALRRNQQHLAVNASRLLRALQSLGLDALIDEATGHQQRRAHDALDRRFAAYLRATAAPHRVTFPESLVRAMHKLYRKSYTGGRQPRWLAAVWERVYRLTLADDIVDELQTRNPEPRFGSNHHQYLSDTVRPLFRDDMIALEAIANTSRNATEFWARCAYHFRKTPMHTAMLDEAAE
jgi:hypothetical protein